MSLGSKIKELRNSNGMTQKELSEQLNVTAQAVSRWESDEVEPSVATIKQMATIFNVSTDELLGNETEPKVVEVEKIVEKPIVVEKPLVIEKDVVVEKPVTNRQAIGVCDYCKKPIYDDENYHSGTHSGRGYHHDYLIHVECEKTKAEIYKKEQAEKNRNRLFLSIFLGLLAFGVAFGIFSFMALHSNTPGSYFGMGAAFGFAMFTMVSCFLLDNNFVFDLFCDIAGWSVRFPGIIFTADLDGLKFLIIMKLLFAVIGVIISILAFIFALLLSGFLSIFVYPFALYKNIKNKN